MWSSVEEIYPVHTSMLQSPQGASVLKEPVTEKPQDNTEYRPVRPPKPPYDITDNRYSNLLGIC